MSSQNYNFNQICVDTMITYYQTSSMFYTFNITLIIFQMQNINEFLKNLHPSAKCHEKIGLKIGIGKNNIAYLRA